MSETTVPAFGPLLRAARHERGLSQAELGGEEYSASYISHLENGRRQPTPEVVQFVSDKLQLTPDHFLAAASAADHDPSRAATITALGVRVQTAAAMRDHGTVISAASSDDLPTPEESPSTWWAITWLKAEAQLASELYDACTLTISDLLASEIASMSAELRSATLTLGSRSLRANGRLAHSLRYANDAVASATESASASHLAIALRERVATLAELGRLEDATAASEELAVLRPQLADRQLLGLVSWTVGNVAFLRMDVQRGLEEHAISAQELRPELDLRLWARFHKASAAMRMAAGVDDDVDRYLEQARHAFALVGNDSDLAELDLLRAERLIDVDPESGLKLADEGMMRTLLPQHTQAEALVLRARALQRLGRDEEAHVDLRVAARDFDAVGAFERSADIWRRLAGEGERSVRPFISRGPAGAAAF